MPSGSRTAAIAAFLVLAAPAVAGCSSSPGEEPVSGSTPSPSQREVASTTPTTSSREPPREPRQAEPYRPNRAEVDAAAKRTAARAVERVPRVARVTYTQYFGYLPPLASILVEADFTAGGGTTYDVRISRHGDAWRVDSLEPAGPVPAVAHPGSPIRRVLASDRIDLPWAGRADVASGRVAASVLRSMLAVSAKHRLGISVLISAHPVHVFGTDRRSNHPDGRAYDIGRIDGHLVVAPRSAGLVREVMVLAARTGAYQVGGPTDLDGSGSQYFSDATHSDHVHVGFSA